MAPTALCKYAKTLSNAEPSVDLEPPMHYPMYTAPLDVVLKMTSLQTHEELLELEILMQFTPAIGKGMFVSHQWACNRHADPGGRQFRVLQGALSNLLSGRARVSPDVNTEMLYGRAPGFSKAALTSKKIFIWYDFFSIPQLLIVESISLTHTQQAKAVASIPAYVNKCELFVALCPVLTHVDTGKSMDQYTWAKRGWCRMERTVRHLLSPDLLMLMIESPKHMTVMDLRDAFFTPFGAGDFTQESDRHAVGRIVKQILQLKLTESLRKGDLCAYRMVLNHQHSLFLDCDIDAITGFLPVRARSSPGNDDAVADFLHQNGFIKVDSRDATGWSPLCYAVTQQSTELVKALLVKKAFPNDQIMKANKKLSMAKGLSILTLCIVYNNNDSLRVLLEARAVPNPKDGFGCTPLYYAAFSNNAKGARLLCDFHADPNIKNKFGFDCVDAAFGFGAKEVAEVVWTTNHAEKPFLLHWAMIFCGGGPDLITQIVERGFELNQQLQATNLEHKVIFGLFAMKCRLGSASLMSKVSYHHHGSTPLMLSILTGKFSAARVLLRAGARVDLRNYRNWTAFDFAVEQEAPESLFHELLRCGAEQFCRPSTLKHYFAREVSASSEVLQDFDEPMISVRF